MGRLPRRVPLKVYHASSLCPFDFAQSTVSMPDEPGIVSHSISITSGSVCVSSTTPLYSSQQLNGLILVSQANNGDASRIGTRGPRNLLELLPDEFTLEDVRRVRQQQGLSNEGYGCMRMIRNWANRNYVIFLGARSNLDYLAVLLD